MALSIPIIFSHMYTLGRIPALRQRGFYFLFLSGTTEVLWASEKGCHILKKSPENMPMAVIREGVIDRFPVSRSGDTSASKPSILGMILSLPMLLYPRTAAIPWIFQQGSLVLTVRELGKNCPVMFLCQREGVEYMGRVWAQEPWSPQCCSDKKSVFTVISSWSISVLPSFL